MYLFLWSPQWTETSLVEQSIKKSFILIFMARTTWLPGGTNDCGTICQEIFAAASALSWEPLSWGVLFGLPGRLKCIFCIKSLMQSVSRYESLQLGPFGWFARMLLLVGRSFFRGSSVIESVLCITWVLLWKGDVRCAAFLERGVLRKPFRMKDLILFIG